MNAGIIINSLNCINQYLTIAQKKEAICLILILIFTSVLEIIGLASVVPIILAASESGSIERNQALLFLFNWLGFKTQSSFFVFLIVLVFIFFLLKNLFTIWVGYKQAAFAAEVSHNILNRQFLKFNRIPLWEYNNIGLVNIMYYITDIPPVFTSGILGGIITIFSETTILLIIITSIFIFKPILIVLLAVSLLPTVFFTYEKVKKKNQQIGNQINVLRPLANSIAVDALSGKVEIKLAGKEDVFRKKVAGIHMKLQSFEARAFLLASLPYKVIEMTAILGIVIIFLYTVLYSKNPKELVFILGLFAASAYRLMPSVNRFMVSMGELKRNQYAIETLHNFNEFDSDDDVTSEAPVTFKKEIELKDVSYCFPGKATPVLEKLSLVINKGNKVGFIGTSGSGKTTLMNLILRFYAEQSGCILVDGVKLNKDNRAAWQQKIGYVKQNAFLMNASIKDNITLFEKDINIGHLEDVIVKACLKNLIDTLPDGVDTIIGDRGTILSGGQQQRIAIARALYKKPDILIFDEATSALDTKTEREVNEALIKLLETNITIIIITHRITSLKGCDKIYEVKNGGIIKQQSYTELLEQVI